MTKLNELDVFREVLKNIYEANDSWTDQNDIAGKLRLNKAIKDGRNRLNALSNLKESIKSSQLFIDRTDQFDMKEPVVIAALPPLDREEVKKWQEQIKKDLQNKKDRSNPPEGYTVNMQTGGGTAWWWWASDSPKTLCIKTCDNYKDAVDACWIHHDFINNKNIFRLINSALEAANPKHEPWKCPHFKALAEVVGFKVNE